MSIIQVDTLQKRDGSTFPIGKIGQVVYASTSTEVNTTSTSYSDTTLTGLITPTATSSKILIIINHNGIRSQSNDNENAINIIIKRNSTEISNFSKLALYTGTALDLFGGSLSMNFLDSPSTTSQINYKTQFKNYVSGGTIRLQDTSAVSGITLMEVLA